MRKILLQRVSMNIWDLKFIKEQSVMNRASIFMIVYNNYYIPSNEKINKQKLVWFCERIFLLIWEKIYTRVIA